MNTEMIRLNFNSGLHIGRGAEELDKTATTYGSDALKSALYSIGINYYPEWKEDAKTFFESFKISSAFPYCGTDYFMPKPYGMKFKFMDLNDLKEAKTAKKIKYVSRNIFSKWVLDQEQPLVVDKRQVGDSEFLFEKMNATKFIQTTVQQRVSVALEKEGETRPFYFERIFFDQGSGLYFLIQFNDISIRLKILHVLRLLGEFGIGTDRTVGNGQFTIEEPVSFDLPQGTKMGMQMTLGLYLPSEPELSNCNIEMSSWTLIRRGGYMAASEIQDFRNLRKNSIYFFGEGSLFKSDIQLNGRYVNLQPDWNSSDMHPVWRCGTPIFINL